MNIGEKSKGCHEQNTVLQNIPKCREREAATHQKRQRDVHAHNRADSNGPLPSVMRRRTPHATNCIGPQTMKGITEVTSDSRNERGMNTLPNRRAKTLHKSIHVLVAVVKRHRSDSKRIGLAPVAEHPFSRKFLAQSTSVLRNSNG